MKKIICLGGGTLGSVTPLLAVVEELLKRRNDLEIIWWGTYNGPESRLVKAAGLPFVAWPAGKWRRYFSWRNLTDLLVIFYAFIKAWFCLKKESPAILLTAGGFVAVPIAWAAWFRGIPVLAHQQDAIVGLANRLLKPIAVKFTLTLSDSFKDFIKSDKTILTGNAVRMGFLNPPSVSRARQLLGLSVDKKTIVFLGGGTGADFINNLVVDNLAELTKLGQVIHLTGLAKSISVESSLNYKTIDLTSDSLNVLQAADVVVSRAGLSTLSELAALAKPAIIIPMPD
ncbi:MAG: glycosyltransferase, partial [Patescibacteria group bacterium]